MADNNYVTQNIHKCNEDSSKEHSIAKDFGNKPRKLSTHCNCNHKAPPLRVLRSTAFNKALATDISSLGLSGDGTVDWALSELWDHHTGKLIPSDFDMVERDSDDPKEVERFDNLWSKSDQRRFINRYKDRAKRKFQYRLKMHCVDSVVMLYFAMEIYHCRTTGKCSPEAK